MALRSRSLFLYGFEVSAEKRYIDFIPSGGSELTAELTDGFYTLSGLLSEAERAMEAVDINNEYGWEADRSYEDGTRNRVSFATSGGPCDLLFGSGTNASSSIASLIGFNASDYTGLTEYTGSESAGTPLVSEREGYSYSGPDLFRKVFGSLSVSSSGVKEALTYSIQKFLEVTFKYEPEEKAISEWSPLFTYIIQQRPYEFTPEIDSPDIFYGVTLEATETDSLGMGMNMKEMLPEFPFFNSTGNLKMRVQEE